MRPAHASAGLGCIDAESISPLRAEFVDERAVTAADVDDARAVRDQWQHAIPQVVTRVGRGVVGVDVAQRSSIPRESRITSATISTATTINKPILKCCMDRGIRNGIRGV
jgi:hypothetical protein